MRASGARFGVTAFCLMLGLALAIAPALEAVHHGPDLTVAETHPHSPDGHDHADDHHDSGDHDHVSVVVLAGDGAEVHPRPSRRVLAGPVRADESPPDNPRRPPRLMTL